MPERGQRQPRTQIQAIPKERLHQLLTTYRPQMVRLLPKHLKADRVYQVMLLAVQRTPRLMQCTEASLIGSLLQCSSLGLEPDPLTGQAYLVPYFNNKIGKYVCELIPGYRGLMMLARRTGKVSRFQAFPIYEGDEFDYSYGTSPTLHFKPRPDRAKRTDGHLTHAFSLAFEEGEPKFYVADREEIDHARSLSKTPRDGPWADFFPAMAMKTAVRRFCKFLPQSNELATAVTLDELNETQLSQNMEALVPELAEPDEQTMVEQEQARADQPRSGGPYPSDVFAAGREIGWDASRVQEFVDNRLQKPVQELERGDECRRVIEAIRAEVQPS